MTDYAELVAKLRDEEPLPWRYVEAAADAIERLVKELSDYMEVEETNRDLVKRGDFWKARAEKLEADLASEAKRINRMAERADRIEARAEKAETALRTIHKRVGNYDFALNTAEDAMRDIRHVEAVAREALKEQG